MQWREFSAMADLNDKYYTEKNLHQHNEGAVECPYQSKKNQNAIVLKK